MSEITTNIKTVQETHIIGYVPCDGCSARSKFLVRFPFGELAFCSHHFSRHEKVIQTISVTVLEKKEDNDAP